MPAQSSINALGVSVCVCAMSVNVCTVFLKKKLRCKINPLNLFQFLSHVINRTSSNEDFVR